MQSRTCMLLILPLTLAGGLAVPATAQQSLEQEARQAGEAIVQAYNKAGQSKDPAALAAVYTEDAILVMPGGPLVGREAIQQYFSEAFKRFTLQAAKLDTATLIAGGQVMLRTGSFTGVLQAPNTTPTPVKGYWATTDVREGGKWKIRLEEDNMASLPASSEQKR
jgi:uncharacterized protein (TIGR02246 family)